MVGESIARGTEEREYLDRVVDCRIHAIGIWNVTLSGLAVYGECGLA